MSSRWMSKVHSFIPLTEQEEQVEDILLQYGIDHLTHAVFPVNNRMYVTDFYLPGANLVIECWRSNSRRGVALNWVEKNACYVDMKFRRIKQAYTEVKCAALVEVPQVDSKSVASYVGAVMEHADYVVYEMTKLAEVLRGSVERP